MVARRVAVTKTYKLYIGGAFPRSESGRTYPPSGRWRLPRRTPRRPPARTPGTRSSPPARPSGSWSTATPYNRGQVIYRIAEMLEGRRAQFVDLLDRRRHAGAADEVDLAVDRLVHYAGWTDKLAAVFGGANPVAGPYFSFSAPEPTGVVAVRRAGR